MSGKGSNHALYSGNFCGITATAINFSMMRWTSCLLNLNLKYNLNLNAIITQLKLT